MKYMNKYVNRRGVIEKHGKVVCIEEYHLFALTLGKIYTYVGEVFVEHTGNDCYMLTNDGGVIGAFKKSLFKPLEEYREDKLKKLLHE